MKTIPLLLIALSLFISSQAQPAFSENQQAVQQTVIKMFDALSNRDSVGLKNYCAPDILLIEYGLTWNLDTLILRGITLNQSPDFKRTNTLDFITTEVKRDVAWANYHLQSEITSAGKTRSVQWIETVILVKDKNSWKIKTLHSTLIKRS